MWKILIYSSRYLNECVLTFEHLPKVSSVITECACGCGNNTTVSPAPLQHTEKRDSPPRDLQYDYGIPPSVEIAPTLTPVGRRPEFDDEAFDKRREMLKNLSVEMSEPEFESISIED